MKGQLVSPEPAVKSVRLDPQDRVVIVASGETKHFCVSPSANTSSPSIPACIIFRSCNKHLHELRDPVVAHGYACLPEY